MTINDPDTQIIAALGGLAAEAPEHRHGVGNLTTAVAAGYRPCQHCRPAA